LKKKLQREGVFREARLRERFEKPSEKRAREKAEGIRRVRKLARKKLERESGISSPKKLSASARWGVGYGWPALQKTSSMMRRH
jgi:small subunit ribosomal protein S21